MNEVQPNFKTDPEPKKKRRRQPTSVRYKNKATRLWGEYVHLRDRVCVACGRGDGKLDAHHILPRTFMATRTDESNGVLLCASHHQLGRESVHQDPQFAVELYTRLLGVDGYAALRKKAYDGGKFGADFWRGEVDRLTDLIERAS